MALTPEEILQFRKKYNIGQESEPTTRPSTATRAKDVLIGAGKGFVESTIGTAKLLQEGGQAAIAAVDPTRNFEQVREQTGFPSLKGQQIDQIESQLASTNTDQKIGKGIAFITELLYPTGAAKKGVDATRKLAGASIDNIVSRSSKLREQGVNLTDDVLDNLAGLDEKTKTALTRTPKDVFEEYLKIGEGAVKDDRARTPLEFVGDNIISGLEDLKRRASSIGAQKSQVVGQAKIGLKRAGSIAREAISDIQTKFSGLKLDSSDQKVINEFIGELKKISKNPTVKDVDATIDLLQDRLYKKTSSQNVVEITDRVTGPLREVLSNLNSKVGNVAGDTYKNLNKEYSELIRLVNEINRRVGKEGSSAGSFVKRLFSPSDARTKELFDELQTRLGKDFTRDARVAKFIMDILGDTRGKSMLENLPTSKSGVVDKTLDFVAGKLADPVKRARSFIDRSGISQ